MQTFQPNSFKPAVVIGTIDSYHLKLLSVALTLAGVTGWVESKSSWIFFSYINQVIRMKANEVMKQFKLNMLIVLLGKMTVLLRA